EARADALGHAHDEVGEGLVHVPRFASTVLEVARGGVIDAQLPGDRSLLAVAAGGGPLHLDVEADQERRPLRVVVAGPAGPAPLPRGLAADVEAGAAFVLGRAGDLDDAVVERLPEPVAHRALDVLLHVGERPPGEAADRRVVVPGRVARRRERA